MSKAAGLSQRLFIVKAWVAFIILSLSASPVRGSGAEHAQFSTNGPVVYRLELTSITNVVPNSRYQSLQIRLRATNTFSPEIIERSRKRLLTEPEFQTNVTFVTNKTTDHLAPGWLNHMVWTNFIAQTNGKSSLMWSTRRHPLTWPFSAPVVRWNTNCLIYGFKGFTAISPCWEGEGASGQVPITLITPRHGYARGHGMGPDGMRTTFNGKRVWFVARDNTMVQARIAGAVVRYKAGLDYTIFLFNEDVPNVIQPMAVMSAQQMSWHYPWLTGMPPLVLQTEQEGRVSVDLPGFKLPVFKGGDSGSPDMVPIGNELALIRGRTTSAPSAEMQADIDELCRLAKLDPKCYQLRWVDVSTWPKYTRR